MCENINNPMRIIGGIIETPTNSKKGTSKIWAMDTNWSLDLKYIKNTFK
jgi:hypothetical protein